jgi:hypothetical protein
LKDVIKVSLLQKWQNDMIKNIVSVFYGIQCSLSNFELSATIMAISSPDHNTSKRSIAKTRNRMITTDDTARRTSEVRVSLFAEDYVNLDSELGIPW